jgi:hypothetical protein
VKLTTDPYLLPRSRMSGAVPQLARMPSCHAQRLYLSYLTSIHFQSCQVNNLTVNFII